MLQEDQQKRPNIYQVVKTVSDLMHVECPIRNVSEQLDQRETADILISSLFRTHVDISRGATWSSFSP